MKPIMNILVLVVVLSLVGANGRHVDGNEYDELPEGEGQGELMNRMKEHAAQMRHRRRSRQMFPYEYQPPYFYTDRRDYNRHPEEYLVQIIKSLDEIINNLRRTPPPPPQPVYIPYPVVQQRPCICRATYNCRRTNKNNETNITGTDNRFGTIDDDNRIWISTPNKLIPEDYDDGGDGSRPISFVPIPPTTPSNIPALPPKAGEETTQAPTFARPGACESAILDCCSLAGKAERATCFANYKCSSTYATNQACRPEVIKQVLDHYMKAYAPVQNNL